MNGAAEPGGPAVVQDRPIGAGVLPVVGVAGEAASGDGDERAAAGERTPARGCFQRIGTDGDVQGRPVVPARRRLVVVGK